MTADELLLALRDIHQPSQPDWWQIAPVWWAVFILLAGFGLFFIGLSRRRKSNRLVSLARLELEAIAKQNADDQRLAQKLSVWLKQVTLLAFPDRQLESLTGRPWLDFLDQCIDDSRFSRGPGEVFGSAIFSQDIDLDKCQVLLLCNQWLVAITPQLQQRSRA